MKYEKGEVDNDEDEGEKDIVIDSDDDYVLDDIHEDSDDNSENMNKQVNVSTNQSILRKR